MYASQFVKEGGTQLPVGFEKVNVILVYGALWSVRDLRLNAADPKMAAVVLHNPTGSSLRRN